MYTPSPILQGIPRNSFLQRPIVERYSISRNSRVFSMIPPQRLCSPNPHSSIFGNWSRLLSPYRRLLQLMVPTLSKPCTIRNQTKPPSSCSRRISRYKQKLSPDWKSCDWRRVKEWLVMRYRGSIINYDKYLIMKNILTKRKILVCCLSVALITIGIFFFVKSGFCYHSRGCKSFFWNRTGGFLYLRVSLSLHSIYFTYSSFFSYYLQNERWSFWSVVEIFILDDTDCVYFCSRNL